MTRNTIIKKSIFALAAAAVLFAITSNVAEAAKINPNPMGKPSTGGTVFGKEKDNNCEIKHALCVTGNYTEKDLAKCVSGRKGARCRVSAHKNRCKQEHRECKKKEL